MKRPDLHPTSFTLAILWLLAGSGAFAQSWVELTPGAGSAPAARRNASAVFDPVDNRMVVYGGHSGGGYLGDIWAFDLDTGSWQDLTPASGPAPAARLTPASVYDPHGHQMIMWSGQGPGTFFNDVWSFDFDSATWSQYSPAGGLPNIRYGVGYTWDPVARDLVTFAGFTNMGRFDDVWRFNDQAVTWTDVSPLSGPLERCLHAACYDAIGHRMIMYGGQNSGALDDLWALDLGNDTWTELTPVSRPAGRYFTALVYDSANRRATVFGGQTQLGLVSEVWVFDLWTGEWTQLAPTGTPPAARYGAAGIYNAAGDRMIVFGGHDGTSTRNDVWAVEGLSDSPTAVRATIPAGAILHANHPNPFNPSTTIRFDLAAGGHVRLRIFDVNGRLVRTLVDGARGAGMNVMSWDGRSDDGAPVVSGIYVSRLDAAGISQSRKMVLLK